MMTIKTLKNKVEVLKSRNYDSTFADFVLDSIYESEWKRKDILARLDGYLEGAIVGDKVDEYIENNLEEFFRLYKL